MVTCHVSSDTLERLFHESFYPAVSIHQFSGRDDILGASIFQLGQKSQGGYFRKGDAPEEKYQCDSVFSWLAFLLQPGGQWLSFFKVGPWENAENLLDAPPAWPGKELSQSHAEWSITAVHIGYVCGVLFIDIVHPEAQCFPDCWVIVSAPCLSLEQAGLLQVVQGQYVLIAVGLEDLPSVIVQHLLLEPAVAHRLEANQSQHLDEWMLLGNAVLDVTVDLEMEYEQTNQST